MGPLTNEAVFAHGIHLADNEADEIVTSGSAVASCPIANFLFSKGITAIEHLRKKELDVGGAYSSSMLSVI